MTKNRAKFKFYLYVITALCFLIAHIFIDRHLVAALLLGLALGYNIRRFQQEYHSHD